MSHLPTQNALTSGLNQMITACAEPNFRTEYLPAQTMADLAFAVLVSITTQNDRQINDLEDWDGHSTAPSLITQFRVTPFDADEEKLLQSGLAKIYDRYTDKAGETLKSARAKTDDMGVIIRGMLHAKGKANGQKDPPTIPDSEPGDIMLPKLIDHFTKAKKPLDTETKLLANLYDRLNVTPPRILSESLLPKDSLSFVAEQAISVLPNAYTLRDPKTPAVSTRDYYMIDST
jgi:hypothetical protein